MRPPAARLWSGVLLVTSLVVFLSPPMGTGPAPGMDVPHLDKLGHALVFAMLAWSIGRGWPMPALLLIGALALYGAAIELAQSAIPGRTPSVADWVADVLGAALGAAVGRRLTPRDSS